MNARISEAVTLPCWTDKSEHSRSRPLRGHLQIKTRPGSGTPLFALESIVFMSRLRRLAIK